MEREPNYIAIGTAALVVLGLIYCSIIYVMAPQIVGNIGLSITQR
jgi:hypothetical protein